MTSRLTLGGNEQSAGSHYGRDTQPDLTFHTYASAAYELAPSLVSQTAEVPSRSHGTRGKTDRALIKWLSDAAFLVGLALFICASAASIPLALFMIFFCRF